MKYTTRESEIDGSKLVVIDAGKLSAVKKFLSSTNSGMTGMADRQELAKRSKLMTKNWPNNVQNQRSQRLKEREERLARDEAERVKLDEQYQFEQDASRQKIIQRAHDLVYREKDHVKTFQSLLLADVVLQGRDVQRKHKISKQLHQKQCQQQTEAVNGKFWDEQEEKESHKHQMADEKRSQFASDLQKQIAGKKELRQREKEQKFEEGAKILKEVEEYKAHLAEKLAREENERKKFMISLLDKKAQLETSKQDEKMLNKNRGERILSEQAVYQAELQLRKDAQTRESKRQREQYVADQTEFFRKQSDQKTQSFENRLKQQSFLEKLQQDRAGVDKEQLRNEAISSYLSQRAKKESALLAQKKEDEAALKLYQKMQKEEAEEKLSIAMKRLAFEKGLQEENAAKTKLMEAALLKDRDQYQSSNEARLKDEQFEREELTKYVETILQEKWLKDNTFTKSPQTYVDVALAHAFSK